jgi:SAM-dependent methyltransferase
VSRYKDAWSSEQFAKESELHWSAWIEGYFTVGEVPGAPSEKLWGRNFQELYTRDVTLLALGDVQGKNGLDVACGAGDYGVVLVSLGAKMACQDLSAGSIRGGRELASKAGVQIDFRTGNAESLQFDDREFDFVLTTDFFEHITIEQKRKVLSEISRVLKPGGVLVIKTPNLTYLRLVVTLKRIVALVRLRSPRIHIAHTRNNPDCEHHGLSTFREMEGLLSEEFFVGTERIPLLLRRGRLPKWLGRRLFGFWPLTEHLILRSQKSVFVPVSDSLALLD